MLTSMTRLQLLTGEEQCFFELIIGLLRMLPPEGVALYRPLDRLFVILNFKICKKDKMPGDFASCYIFDRPMLYHRSLPSSFSIFFY